MRKEEQTDEDLVLNLPGFTRYPRRPHDPDRHGDHERQRDTETWTYLGGSEAGGFPEH